MSDVGSARCSRLGGERGGREPRVESFRVIGTYGGGRCTVVEYSNRRRGSGLGQACGACLPACLLCMRVFSRPNYSGVCPPFRFALLDTPEYHLSVYLYHTFGVCLSPCIYLQQLGRRRGMRRFIFFMSYYYTPYVCYITENAPIMSMNTETDLTSIPLPFSSPSPFQAHLRKTARVRCKAAEAANRTTQQGNADADAAAGGGANGGAAGGASPRKPNPAVEVVLARLLTDTLTSLTREFEKEALMSGEVSLKTSTLILLCMRETRYIRT